MDVKHTCTKPAFKGFKKPAIVTYSYNAGLLQELNFHHLKYEILVHVALYIALCM